MPSWAKKPNEPGWAYYRLQDEGSFDRFFLSPDRRTWVVQLKGGALLEFGQPRDLGQPGHPGHLRTGSTLSGPAIKEEDGAIMRWRLVRQLESARPQNLVVYRWLEIGRRGLLYLTDVWDTPRATGPMRLSGFAHHTQLSWEPSPSATTAYAHGDRAAPDQRLTRVAVASATWEGEGPREVVRLYRLRYYGERQLTLAWPSRTATYDPATQAPLFGHSFLRAISLEGRCGQHEDDAGAVPSTVECGPEALLPPTTFEYQGDVTDTLTQWPSSLVGGPPGLESTNQVLPYLNSAALVDFNRDGLPDVVQSWDAEPYCFGKQGQITVHLGFDYRTGTTSNATLDCWQHFHTSDLSTAERIQARKAE